MSGIDRLRAIAGAWDEWGLGGTLAEIADEIDRELQEERDRWDSELCEAQMDKSRVTAVYLEMNKHVLGHEGMEDSPVARWARELRSALKSDTSDERDAQNPSCTGTAEAADVTSEAQKVTREDVDAIAWVREHGGLEELEKRLMPEGVEWPRYESGELVDFGDEVARDDDDGDGASVDKIVFYGDQWRLYDRYGCEINEDMIGPGERVKRPAVPAADGKPLEVGQTVWDTNGDELVIVAFEDGSNTVTCRYADVGDSIPTHGMWSPSQLTHERPVLGADGVPTKTCQKMWRVRNGEEVRVSQIDRGEHPVITYVGEDGLTHEITPDGLIHTKPEPKRICGDCRHWQGDPSASHMGVCFNSYMERCCVDSYAAQLDYAKACDDFEERSE